MVYLGTEPLYALETIRGGVEIAKVSRGVATPIIVYATKNGWVCSCRVGLTLSSIFLHIYYLLRESCESQSLIFFADLRLMRRLSDVFAVLAIGVAQRKENTNATSFKKL